MESIKLNKYLIKIINDYNDRSIEVITNILKNNIGQKMSDLILKYDLLDLILKCVQLGYKGFYIFGDFNLFNYLKNNENFKNGLLKMAMSFEGTIFIELDNKNFNDYFLCNIGVVLPKLIFINNLNCLLMESVKLNKYLLKIINDYNVRSNFAILRNFHLKKDRNVMTKNIKKYELIDLIMKCSQLGYTGFYVDNNQFNNGDLFEYWSNENISNGEDNKMIISRDPFNKQIRITSSYFMFELCNLETIYYLMFV